MLTLFSLIFTQMAFATELKLGTFSLATEAGWTAWFELQDKDQALITPKNDTEDFDPASKDVAKPIPIKGTWKRTSTGIEIHYGQIIDSLQLEARCMDWPIHPCFKFLSSKSTGKEKSLLNYKQPYINWSWTISPPKELSKSELNQCKKECAELAAKKKLKKGMDEKSCVDLTCKPLPPPGGYQ